MSNHYNPPKGATLATSRNVDGTLDLSGLSLPNNLVGNSSGAITMPGGRATCAALFIAEAGVTYTATRTGAVTTPGFIEIIDGLGVATWANTDSTSEIVWSPVLNADNGQAITVTAIAIVFSTLETA